MGLIPLSSVILSVILLVLLPGEGIILAIYHPSFRRSSSPSLRDPRDLRTPGCPPFFRGRLDAHTWFCLSRLHTVSGEKAMRPVQVAMATLSRWMRKRASPAFHSYLRCQAERVGALLQRVTGIKIPCNWPRICLHSVTSFREHARRLCVLRCLDLKSEPQYVFGDY